MVYTSILYICEVGHVLSACTQTNERCFTAKPIYKLIDDDHKSNWPWDLKIETVLMGYRSSVLVTKQLNNLYVSKANAFTY